MSMTIEQVQEFARLRGQLGSKAAAEFERLALAIDWQLPDAMQLLHSLAASIMSLYGAASGELSLRWLERCAEVAGETLAAGTIAMSESSRSVHDGLAYHWARWRDGELTRGDAARGMADRTAGGVLRAGDESMFGSLPRKTLYTRVASPTACAFCRLVASNDNLWFDPDKAGFDSHSGCNCVAVPFTSAKGIAGYSNQTYREEYDRAVEALNVSDRDPELERRLEEAKATHSSRTEADWTSTNSILVAMRYLDGADR